MELAALGCSLSMGPAVFLGSPQTRNTTKARIWIDRQTTHLCYRASVVPSSTKNNLHTVHSKFVQTMTPKSRTVTQRLVPPGVCGHWPLLAVWALRFPGLNVNPQRMHGPCCSLRLLAAPNSEGPLSWYKGSTGLSALKFITNA